MFQNKNEPFRIGFFVSWLFWVSSSGLFSCFCIYFSLSPTRSGGHLAPAQASGPGVCCWWCWDSVNTDTQGAERRLFCGLRSWADISRKTAVSLQFCFAFISCSSAGGEWPRLPSPASPLVVPTGTWLLQESWCLRCSLETAGPWLGLCAWICLSFPSLAHEQACCSESFQFWTHLPWFCLGAQNPSKLEIIALTWQYFVIETAHSGQG